MSFNPQELEYIALVRRHLPPGLSAYLVGGGLRDLLLEQPRHDLDFVLPGSTRKVATAVARALGAAWFALDDERATYRVILKGEDGTEFYLDFIKMQGGGIEEDLATRDFTLNAMAVRLEELDQLVDPLGGLADLRAKRLKACGAGSLDADPLRCLRGLRIAHALDLRIEKGTVAAIRKALPGLAHVSPERIRDELMRLFAAPGSARAIRNLAALGGLTVLFPELVALQGTLQGPPHEPDAWEHSLAALRELDGVLSILTVAPEREGKGTWLMGMISLHLGRYRERIATYLAECTVPHRSRRALLGLATLYHDSGKPQTVFYDEEEKLHFYRHDEVGAPLVGQCARRLALANDEVDWLERVVAQHMRIHFLAKESPTLPTRSIYRFFRATGNGGVAVCLLSLADLLSSAGTTLTRERLEAELGVCRQLLEAWWDQPGVAVAPPRLVDGADLMAALGLSPGPRIGELLECVRLAQVEGRVADREGALAEARRCLEARPAAADSPR